MNVPGEEYPIGSVWRDPLSGDLYIRTDEGWIENPTGQALDRERYPMLYEVIGTHYGESDDATFRLPDFRGREVL